MATIVQPPFYVPSVPEDQPWTAQPYQMNADAPGYLSASFLLKSRAITAQNQRDYDEGSVWQAQPYQMESKLLAPILTSQKLFGAPGQVPTKNWVSQYTHDDASLQGAMYQAAPRQSEAIRITTTQLKLYGQPGQVQAKNWATIHHYDETGPWDSRPLHSFTMIVQTTLPIFFGQVGQVPMKNWSPIYCYDDPGVWNEFSAPRSSALLQPLLTAAGKVAAKSWGQVYTYDDHSVWSPPSPNMLLFPLVIPSEFRGARYWHNYYDDDIGWVGSPRGSGANAGAPFMVPAKQWRYDYDETGLWDARSKLSAIIFYPLPGEPFPAKFWKNDYDEGGFWVSTSKAEPVVLLPKFTAQVTPAFYAPHPPDDQPYIAQPYQLGADSIVLLASHGFFGAGGQVITKHWEYAYDYDETGLWSPTRLGSATITTTVSQVKFFGQSGQAPTKDWTAQLTYDDPSLWQGAPLSSQAINITPATAPRLPRFWRWDNDDPSIWLAQPVGSYLTRQTFTKPFLPNFFEYIDDPSFWQGTPRGPEVVFLTGAPTPKIPRIWRFDYDETGVWQLTPLQAKSLRYPAPPFRTPSVWAFNAAYQDDGSFYVAQSAQFNADILQQLSLPGLAPIKEWSEWLTIDDPSLWTGKPISSNTMTILTANGMPGATRWDWDHDNTSWWEAKPQGFSEIQRVLSFVTQPPTKQWSEWQTQDDPPVWSGSPLVSNTLSILISGGFPVSALWTWDFDDAGVWYPNPKPVNLLSRPPQEPFKAPQWKFDYDETGVWQLGNFRFFGVLAQSLTANVPKKDFFWKYDYDDGAPWLAAPLKSVVLAELLTGGGNPIVPRFWKYDYDEAAPWLAAPFKSVVLAEILTSGGKPSVPVFWKYDYDEASVWLASPLKSRILATTFPALNPVLPRQWVNPLDDPSIWLAQPIPSSVPELFATSTVPLRNRFWKNDYDELPIWPSAPVKIGHVITNFVATIGNVPFVNPNWYWTWTNDDPPPWTVVSSGIPPMVRALTIGGQPPTRRWEPILDYDDPGPWNEFAVPRSSAVLRPILTSGTPFHKLWTWDFDEGGLWTPKIPTNFQLINPLLPPSKSIFWKFGQFTQDDSSVWSGQPLLSPTLMPILTTGGQPPTKRWEPVVRYDVDAAAWETTRRENLILLTTPIPNPIIPRQWRWDYMIDEPLWQKGPTSAWIDQLISPPPIPVNIDRLLLNYGTRVRSLANNHARVRLLANTRPRRDEI